MTKKKKHDLDLLNIIQIVMLVILIIYIGFLLSNQGDSDTPFNLVSEQTEKAFDLSKVKKGDAKDLKRYYGLNEKDYEQVLFYRAESAMDAEELLIVKVKSKEQTEGVESAMSGRVKTQISSFEGYGIEQTELLKNAIIEIRGSYVFLAVSPDAVQVHKAFRDSL